MCDPGDKKKELLLYKHTGANSLLLGHARLPHRLSHVLTLALRTLVRAELRLADLPPESSRRVSGMRAGRASRRTGGTSDPWGVCSAGVLLHSLTTLGGVRRTMRVGLVYARKVGVGRGS